MIFSVLVTVLTACREGTDTARDDQQSLREVKPAEPLHNPERGFHLESIYFIHNLKNPWEPYVYPEGWIEDMNRNFNSGGDKLSSLQLYIYLTEYVGKDLPEEAFVKMEKMFDNARSQGYKFILRFAYDTTFDATNAAFDDVFRHLNQLEPFIKKNIGLIDVWQMGFIGAWGEGHNSPMSDDWENRSKMVSKMLEMVPGRQTTMRYPKQKYLLSLPADQMDRIGYNNDYFTASEHPLAPENDYVLGTNDYKQVVEESPYVKVIGEIPYAEETKWGLHKLISVENSLKILRDHHYSLFDITQNNELNIAHWKVYPLHPALLDRLGILYDNAYFQDINGDPVQRSAYDFIRDHLGYRLLFDFEETRLDAAQNKLTYDIRFRNVGFSAIINPRPVYLVFIDNAGEVVHRIPLETDPKEWQPYDPDKQDYKVLTHQIKGVADVPLKGTCKVGLWLPDPATLLQYDAKYAIQFANSDLEIWQDSGNRYRINVLGEVTFQ